MSHLITPRARTFVCLLASLAVASMLATVSAAQVIEVDLLADSSIELSERADSGAYQRYTITLASRQGVASLVADKDGIRVESEIPAGEYLALWKQLLQADLRTLVSPAGGGALPDQSRFSVRHHIGADAGEFTAYGVDTLDDTRYRRVVRAILALGDRYMARAR